MFINRDITRADLMALVRQCLSETSGNYRAVLRVLAWSPATISGSSIFSPRTTARSTFGNSGPDRARERSIEPPLRIPTGAAGWGLGTASPLEGKTA